MIDPTIPLLNAQQQGMSPLINALATRSDVIAQTSQVTVAELIKEESEKLDKIEGGPEGLTVTDQEHTSQEFVEQEYIRREPEEDIESAPSYHNPLAGHLLNTKV